MDLDVLKSFLRIVELGSVSRAASELGISQPALTRQMKRLEMIERVDHLGLHGVGIGVELVGPVQRDGQNLIFDVVLDLLVGHPDFLVSRSVVVAAMVSWRWPEDNATKPCRP